jgi:type IX secretion system PorP/SprF family membrane protein
MKILKEYNKMFCKATRTIFLVTLFGMLLIPEAKSQQDPLYTQFMSNPYVLNPGVAGIYPYYQIRSNHRFQWTGFQDAPITNTLCFYGPLRDQPMGVGAIIFNDIAGQERKTALYGSYAYQYPITDLVKVSMGLHVGGMQYRIDGSSLYFNEEGDPLQMGSESKFVPDASVGIYLFSSEFHVGFAATQLINNKLKIGEQPTGLSKLKSHFYLTSSYKYFINREWAVEPALMLKAVSPAPIQADFGGKVFYMNMLSLGVHYRTQDAVSVMLGYVHEKKIYFSYSYDVGVSDFRSYHSGSHEVMIGFRFNDLR